MRSQFDTGFNQDVDGIMREMGWGEIRREAPASRLWHQQRIEACYPVMPFLAREAGEKRSGFPVNEPPFNDGLA
jgi:hypothetical protein